jgi:hypothetical protein
MFERTVQPVLDVQDKPKPAQWAFLKMVQVLSIQTLQISVASLKTPTVLALVCLVHLILVFNRTAYFSSIISIRNWNFVIHTYYQS